MIDVGCATPLYEQVKDDLSERIWIGELQPGTRIPSEKELAEHYGVSTITIRRAVSELVESNLLERKQGKGTFVLRKAFNRSFKQQAMSFTEICRSNNMKASARLLHGEIIYHADEALLRKLELPPDSPVVYIERLRFADDQPIVIEGCWFPPHYSYLLDINLEHESMYKAIQEREKDIRIIVRSGERIIRLVNADKRSAELLNIRTGSAVLSLESVTYDEISGSPIHASAHIGYAQKYNFAVVV